MKQGRQGGLPKTTEQEAVQGGLPKTTAQRITMQGDIGITTHQEAEQGREGERERSYLDFWMCI